MAPKAIHWSGVAAGDTFDLELSKPKLKVKMRRHPETGLSESLEIDWSFSPAAQGDAKINALRSAVGNPGRAMRTRLTSSAPRAKQVQISFTSMPPPAKKAREESDHT